MGWALSDMSMPLVDHEMRMVAMGHNIRKMAYSLAV